MSSEKKFVSDAEAQFYNKHFNLDKCRIYCKVPLDLTVLQQIQFILCVIPIYSRALI